MTLKDKIKQHIETENLVMIKPITEAELKDRSDGIEGRFGWLTPVKHYTGAHTEWHVPVCIEVMVSQLNRLNGTPYLDLYLKALGFWIHSHIDHMNEGVTDFTERERRIEAELLDTAPDVVHVLSRAQLQLLD